MINFNKLLIVVCMALVNEVWTQENIARQKTSAASYDGYNTASQANDGDQDTMFRTSNDEQGWWGVDLGRVTPVHTVGIVHKALNQNEADGFVDFYILVSNTSWTTQSPSPSGPGYTTCFYHAGAMASQTEYYNCEAGLVYGRYVYVQASATNHLHLQEVEVYSEIDWCYGDSSCGPSGWNKFYPGCSGSQQSPVDLQDNTTTKHTWRYRLSFLSFSSDDTTYTLENTGHYIKMNLEYSSEPFEIMHGPLNGRYKVDHVVFHAGSVNSKGSEHTRNGQHYPLEMQLMTYNKNYASFDEAKNKTDGIAVVGVFFQITSMMNFDLYALGSALTSVTKPGRTYEINNGAWNFRLDNILPSNKGNYFAYRGSLTYPDCVENVQWIVLTETVDIDNNQIGDFRHFLTGNNNRPLTDNYRPTQPLNGRTVLKSF